MEAENYILINEKLKESILKTIQFFGIFKFPLTADEIKKHLYQYEKAVHIKEIKGTLNQIEGIEKIHDYHILKGKNEWVDLRKSHKFISEKLWGRVRQYSQYITQIPFVKMIAVCNNLAYDNANEKSDIDLFIVIKPNRMWTARILITAILQFFGVRRHGKKITGRFCLSFFVTEKKLNLKPHLIEPEDPYLAYWSTLMVPIFGKETYEKFKQENEKWLKEKYHLKFGETNQNAFPFEKRTWQKNFLEWILKGWVGNQIENLLKHLFKKRALKKSEKLNEKASVIISDDILKFHNLDRRKEYLEKWKKNLKSKEG